MNLVCLAEVAWGYFRTRKRFLLTRLAARGWRVVYMEPPAFGRNEGRLREEDGVTVCTVPFLKPATSVPLYNAAVATPFGRGIVEGIARSQVAAWSRRLGLDGAVCVISNVYAASALPALHPKLICYDFNDHPLQFPSLPGWVHGYLDRALAKSDLVVAVSETYRRMLAERVSVPVHLLENGVEYTAFAEPEGPVPPDLERLPPPRVGYLGKISDFVDFTALRALADADMGSVVLAGPVPVETRRELASLATHPRVHYLGERPYEEVPRFFAGLDVGLIPFRADHAYTLGIRPNKLYQYMAAGLPFVASPIEGMTADPAGVYFASTPDAFVRETRRALDTPPDRDALRARARAQDWDVLANRLDEILRGALATRSSQTKGH